jgi:hypothetical protein
LRASQRVEINSHTEPLRFVLHLAGRIQGTVLDPAGRPVVAELRVTKDGRWDTERTDGDGRFDVGATSSPVVLEATCAGFARTEPVELTFPAGESVEGIVLRLRAACRLAGRVLAADGTPLAGQLVGVNCGAEHYSVETDARGEFVLDDLPPGAAEASVFVPDRSMARERVTLVAGTTSVELRLLPPDPVLVRGRVTSRGQGAVYGITFWSPTGVARCESDPDGRYEVTLNRPGIWTVLVRHRSQLGTPGDVRAPHEGHENRWPDTAALCGQGKLPGLC